MKRNASENEEEKEEKKVKKEENESEDEEDSDFKEEEENESEEEEQFSTVQFELNSNHKDKRVYIQNPKLDELENKDDIIIKKKNISIEFSYPLYNKIRYTFDTDAEGFSRHDILQLVSETYEEIYKIENETSKIKESTLEGTNNRNGTNGKFSIYGHFLKNLVLYEIKVFDQIDIANIILDVSI